MSAPDEIRLEVLIFGGGGAGLWLLDDLRRAGYRVLLLEADALGEGQTITSQGIIHGGLKYTLSGLFTPSADAIRDMPQVWRDCLAGRREPDLRRTHVRAEHCHLWRTGELRSRLGMLGARVGLRVAPTRLDPRDWPAALHGCPGDVFRLDEQVIEPASLLADLAARNAANLLAYDRGSLRVEIRNQERSAPAGAVCCTVRPTETTDTSVALWTDTVVLTAGAGNAGLRRRCGLDAEAMQRRPLHMVLVRGDLPALNGHCADGARTRVTITSARASDGRRVWQVGGQVAEDGVGMERSVLIDHARRELAAALPGVRLDDAQWATYRVDRAEAAAGGRRPETATLRCDGPVLTAWPTKLALAPRLAADVRCALPPPRDAAAAGDVTEIAARSDWPRPRVALPPWESELEWTTAS